MPQNQNYIDASVILERVAECEADLDGIEAVSDDPAVIAYVVGLRNKIKNNADAVYALAMAIKLRNAQ